MLYHLLVIIVIVSSCNHHHSDLQGPQKYRLLPPSDRRGPSREGRRAPANVRIEEFDHDHDEVFDGRPECDDGIDGYVDDDGG